MSRVLIVDDDEASRVLLGRIFEDAGHEVCYASDGEAALRRLALNTFHAVVTDLAMPGFNGLRLIRHLREMGDDIPVIAVSGQNADQLVLAEDYGAEATLAKPIDRRRIVERVEEAIDASGRFWENIWL